MEHVEVTDITRIREIALSEAIRVVAEIVKNGSIGGRRASDEVVIAALQFTNFLTDGKLTAASEIPIPRR